MPERGKLRVRGVRSLLAGNRVRGDALDFAGSLKYTGAELPGMALPDHRAALNKGIHGSGMLKARVHGC
jgi:hypothetical protein